MNAQWAGVVGLENMGDGKVLIKSRSLQHNMRAISTTAPLPEVVRFFKSSNSKYACVYAEFSNGHLQLIERASLKQFYEHQDQFSLQ